MKNSTRTILILSIALLLGGWYVFHNQKAPPTPAPVLVSTLNESSEEPPTGTVLYGCAKKKNIIAEYNEEDVAPGETQEKPFLPKGSVHIKLSDGREMTLRQTMSNNGARYANADQSFVFWGRGQNRAFVLENNTNVTYVNCVRVVESPDGNSLPEPYSHSGGVFSLRLPAGYVSDEFYKYEALGPGKEIEGIKFTVSPLLTKGTNLSEDSYLSVELIPKAEKCTADMFLDTKVTPQTVNENGVDYSMATAVGAAAGNRYDETIYALADASPCLAVRYFIHYGVMENYPKGAVKEFDTPALLRQFDAIRNTLLVIP